MCIFELTAILDQYNIAHRIKDGKVMALGKNDLWVDVTNWSRLQMARWLSN